MTASPPPSSLAPTWPQRIAYLTSGAAGMFCGSCLHDNTLARALLRHGVDTLLVPTYTPIRTDEPDVSVSRVFFGGISVYLEQRFPPFRWIPRAFTRWLDHPRLLRWATRFGMQTSASLLGALAVSMLQGSRGRQHREADQLVRWLADEVRPDLICLTNVLIAGCAPELRAACRCPVVVTLQGDDIFLDELPPEYRSQAEAEIRRLVGSIDGFLTHSRYYAEHLGPRLGIPPEKLFRAPLGIDTTDFDEQAEARAAGRLQRSGPLVIGYLARLAPEKGLHRLIDAFLELRRRPNRPAWKLQIAGWLGEHRRAWVDEQLQRLRDAGLGDSFECQGEVDREGKRRFLESIDLLSVPTEYADPKGLFVLESLAAGVPVVQPAHGAFPELLEATGGGLLTPPGDARALADAWESLLLNDERRRSLGLAGRRFVHEQLNARSMAARTLDTFRQVAATVGERQGASSNRRDD